MKKNFLIGIFILLSYNIAASQVLVEAESFEHKGGWVVDPQFMDQMGSPYLMAHGKGVPVENARTTVLFPRRGVFKVWVRTYNWVSPWYTEDDGPGAFQVAIDGKALPGTLGTKGSEWMWQEAGVVDLTNAKGKHRDFGAKAEVELVDLTGFNGRVDAILFSMDMDYVPSNDKNQIDKLRDALLPKKLNHAGHFDLVVVGGGTAGASAALSAARLGLKVALINNRPVLGGNNSSEIRVGLSGKINTNYYPKLGNALRELTGIPIPENSHEEVGRMHPPEGKPARSWITSGRIYSGTSPTLRFS